MTYEYMCKKCKHLWEAEQKISAKPLTKCPKCKLKQAQRLISNGNGFILKGGGWADNGYS